MPAIKLNGILVYLAAFKKHIGFYPPISGDARLDERAAAPYAGEKGNLRFPLDTIPYDLIRRLTEFRVKQDLAKAAADGKTSRS